MRAVVTPREKMNLGCKRKSNFVKVRWRRRRRSVWKKVVLLRTACRLVCGTRAELMTLGDGRCQISQRPRKHLKASYNIRTRNKDKRETKRSWKRWVSIRQISSKHRCRLDFLQVYYCCIWEFDRSRTWLLDLAKFWNHVHATEIAEER